MAPAKSIHFGHYVRWKRLTIGGEIRTISGFAAKADLSDKRVIDIEKMPTPEPLQEGNHHAIAHALGMTKEQLDREWQRTPVPAPKLKPAANRPGQLRIIRVPDETWHQLHHLATHAVPPHPSVESFLIAFASIETKGGAVSPPSPPAGPAPGAEAKRRGRKNVPGVANGSLQ